MKTILCHFFNEEYLLPWWLRHHKKMFNHGIMINYASTDLSVNIIKEICPTWQIINSRNDSFDCKKIDEELFDVETQFVKTGWRICLNVTEFLVGDIGLLEKTDNDILVRSAAMIDPPFLQFVEPDSKKSLLSQRHFGYYSNDAYCKHRGGLRLLTKNTIKHPEGRHHFGHVNLDFIIAWYGYSPFTENLLKRKLQIQSRIPEHDKINKKGFQHITTKDEQCEKLKMMQPDTIDLSFMFEKYF